MQGAATELTLHMELRNSRSVIVVTDIIAKDVQSQNAFFPLRKIKDSLFMIYLIPLNWDISHSISGLTTLCPKPTTSISVSCGVKKRARLVGLVVRRPPRERKIPGSNPACAGIFFGVESYQ